MGEGPTAGGTERQILPTAISPHKKHSHLGPIKLRLIFIYDDDDDDDDVELNVSGCRGDISGTNCDQRVRTVQCCFTSTRKP